jgi:hypothetical protein
MVTEVRRCAAVSLCAAVCDTVIELTSLHALIRHRISSNELFF